MFFAFWGCEKSANEWVKIYFHTQRVQPMFANFSRKDSANEWVKIYFHTQRVQPMFANFSLQIYDNFSIFKHVNVKNFALGCVCSVFFVPLSLY